MADIIVQPLKFLGATVLSFSTSIGFGTSSESTLSVELVEDCDAGDLFWPSNNLKEVGDSVFFNCGAFSFGGILTSWTTNQSSSGKTFSVRASDPKQLLENFVLILEDTTPINNATNILNLWNYWDWNPNINPPAVGQAIIDQGSQRIRGGFLAGPDNIPDPNQGQFGKAQSSERGMKYRQIIDALELLQNQIILYSNTGYQYSVDFTTFPNKLLVPDFYRIQGNTTLLALLQNVCDTLGYEFYVNLLPGNKITIGLIDLKVNPGNFAGLINAFDGCATDLSYGQELRQDKLKTVLYGDKIHLNESFNKFYIYFGSELFEDANGNKILRHVVPHDQDGCGFWISKMITDLNASLHRPIPFPLNRPADVFTQNGPYNISEFDIRAAMSGIKLWQARVFDDTIPGSFNAAVRIRFPELASQVRNAINNIAANQNAVRGMPDVLQNPALAKINFNKNNEDAQDLEKVFAFVKQLGDIYYGRQFLVDVGRVVKYYLEDDNIRTLPNPEQANFMFTHTPTNAGGWSDPNQAVLGLNDPDLQFFRSDDGRVGCFAKFGIDIANPNIDDGKRWFVVSTTNNQGKSCIKCEKREESSGVMSGAFNTEADCKESLKSYNAELLCDPLNEQKWYVASDDQYGCLKCVQSVGNPQNKEGPFDTEAECQAVLNTIDPNILCKWFIVSENTTGCLKCVQKPSNNTQSIMGPYDTQNDCETFLTNNYASQIICS